MVTGQVVDETVHAESASTQFGSADKMTAEVIN